MSKKKSPIVNYQARSRSKRKSRITLTRFRLFALCLGLLFVVCLGLHLYFSWERGRLLQVKQKLLLTNATLSEKITRLKTDPKAYEEVARQKYGLIKPDERLIILE